MKTPLLTASVLAVAVGCLTLGSTAGAVAGAQITSAQIKNGTIKSVDVKDGGLLADDLAPSAIAALQGKTGPAGPAGQVGPAGPRGASGVLGREEVNTSLVLAANTPKTNLTATCPVGKVAIGGAAFWTTSSVAVQFTINIDAVRAFTPGVPAADTLNVRAICVNQ